MKKTVVAYLVSFGCFIATAFAQPAVLPGEEYVLSPVKEGWEKFRGSEYFSQCGRYFYEEKDGAPGNQGIIFSGIHAGAQPIKEFRGFVYLSHIEVVTDNTVAIPIVSLSVLQGKQVRFRINIEDLNKSPCLRKRLST